MEFENHIEVVRKASVALDTIETGQPASTNSDYAAALTVYDEYMEHETTSRYSLPNFRDWLKQRLNADTHFA